MNDLETMKNCLNCEEELRRSFLKYRIPGISSKIISIARKNNCGIKFVGGGGGGCLWILGEEDKINLVKDKVSKLKSIKILEFSIDQCGVQSHIVTI